jgi:hypothetical protein
VELSNEDLLRLNVLLAHNVEAVRIDEQSMSVHALAGDSEACVPLNPNCRAESYLRRVREVLSSHALGSPGGYPVFLQRWTRMGQQRGSQLDKLLLLGEPEAVVAVAGAAELTEELARRAWWCQPTMENARRMLAHPTVVKAALGKVLADFLVEHLPFEDEHTAVITTIKLILQPDLISDTARERIWSRGNHRNAYRLGFLEATPHDLPDPKPARADFEQHALALAPLAQAGNPYAQLLLRLLSREGQTYLSVSEELLKHPLDKFTVAVLFDNIGRYFAPAKTGGTRDDANAAYESAMQICDTAPGDLATLRDAAPALRPEIVAMLALAHTGEPQATPVIAKTSASGTLLRKKLEGVTGKLFAHYATLRGISF